MDPRTRTRSTRRSATLLLALALGLAGCASVAETSEAGETAVAPPQAAPVPDPEPAPEPESESDPEPEPERSELTQVELDTALRTAAWANDVEAAERLVGWGADVNAKDDTVQSAYLIATSEGHLELLRLTLAHGADVSDLDSWVGTGLIRAAERGHWEVVGELIQSGVPLDHVNRVGYQAIHEAVWFGRDDPSYHATVRVLVAGGVDATTPSVHEQLTPLQMAHSKGFPAQADLLDALTAAALPEEPEAALLAAAASGDANAAVLALRAGAAPDARDTGGRVALELAEDRGHLEVAQVIRALGG